MEFGWLACFRVIYSTLPTYLRSCIGNALTWLSLDAILLLCPPDLSRLDGLLSGASHMLRAA